MLKSGICRKVRNSCYTDDWSNKHVMYIKPLYCIGVHKCLISNFILNNFRSITIIWKQKHIGTDFRVILHDNICTTLWSQIERRRTNYNNFPTMTPITTNGWSHTCADQYPALDVEKALKEFDVRHQNFKYFFLDVEKTSEKKTLENTTSSFFLKRSCWIPTLAAGAIHITNIIVRANGRTRDIIAKDFKP